MGFYKKKFKKRNYSVKNYIKKKEIENRKKIRHKKRYDLETRLGWIFKTGKTIDFTAMEEIDTWFLPLWKQYEYLTYLEIYYKYSLLKAIEKGILTNKDFENEKFIEDIKTVLEEIRKRKKELIKYMFNGINIIYGSVLKNKFGKWKSLRNVLTSKFLEITIENIKKLKYNTEVARPTIYFFQSFWLGGLSLINKIKEERKRRKLRIEDEKNYEEFKFNDRGNKLISNYKEFIEELNLEHDTILELEEKENQYITEDEAELLKIYNNEEIENKYSLDELLEYSNNNETILNLNDVKNSSISSDDDNYIMSKEEIEKIRLKTIEIVRKLISKAGIDINMLYSTFEKVNSDTASKRKIELFRKIIKNKLGNDIFKYLTEEEQKIIEKYLELVRKGLI
jgi:hypothetical protein